MMEPKVKQQSAALSVGLLGLGVVGDGVATTLLRKALWFQGLLGVPLSLGSILVRDPQKPRNPEIPLGLITTEPNDILEDPSVGIVVEVLGGEHPALELITRALECGKHVVTANKEVMAKHGLELLKVAETNGVQLLFEASVGGGVPIIGPLLKDFAANEIHGIHAVINGTTNYILTLMGRDGLDFATALRQAQDLGYAEPDPTNDIEGIDAAYKLAILAALAFRTKIDYGDVYREGITRLEDKDFQYAEELGYIIKLLAIARKGPGGLQLRVHPAFISRDHLLAKVDGVFNAIEIQGDLVGATLVHGKGAGSAPTSSAVVGNVLDIARGILNRTNVPSLPPFMSSTEVESIEDLRTAYYLRLLVADQAGVLHQIAAIFSEMDISIASVIQKAVDDETHIAEIVITTHPALGIAMQKALTRLELLEVISRVGNCIRIEQLSS